MTHIILASSSPRRRELLDLAGIPHTVDPADVDESALPGEPPEQYAVRVALDKAKATAARHASGIVIGADTIVVVDQEILGKPAGPENAIRMLSLISGRTHKVLTGVALVDAATGREETFVESTDVKFSPLAAHMIDDYVSTGEPLDKAGAYGIQGRASVFVEGISGCFFNVVGLPLSRLKRALDGFII